MTNFFVFLLFAGIGSIFGPVGFFIGLILGIFGWIGAANKKTESKSVPAKKEVPIFTGIEHKVSSTPEFQSTANPGSEQAAEYATVTSYLYAYIFCFYPVNDTSKVDEVTDLLRKDDWILDKSQTLDEVAERLSIIQIERRDSPMLFKLHSEALLERTLRLPRPMKSRLLMQLDSLSTGLRSVHGKRNDRCGLRNGWFAVHWSRARAQILRHRMSPHRRRSAPNIAVSRSGQSQGG